jgi:hypothetical protein
MFFWREGEFGWRGEFEGLGVGDWGGGAEKANLGVEGAEGGGLEGVADAGGDCIADGAGRWWEKPGRGYDGLGSGAERGGHRGVGDALADQRLGSGRAETWAWVVGRMGSLVDTLGVD